MQPTTTPEAHTPRPALPDEAERQALAAELEIHIDALNEYCDQDPQPERAQQINELIALFGQYDQATEQLLSGYRYALEHAQRPVIVPNLEQAILAKMSPADLLAYRQADPVYRLGYARGYRVAEQKYERLSSLYAQYALIVPPAGYTPSPLVAQVQRFVATRLMTGPRFPLEVRKSLFFSTPATPRPNA
ncbi:MAG: hypothetical protein ACRYFZ_07310 [Janthinobacterium lividum]